MSSCEGMAQFFRRAREQSGLTQKDVAKALGYLTPQFVSNWERGQCGIPVSVLVKLIDLYKLNKAEVIKLALEAEQENWRRSFLAYKK